MTVTIPAYTTVFGAATLNYATGQPAPIGGMVITVPPALAADVKKLSATFTPADSSVLDVVSRIPIHGDANHDRQAHRQLHGDDQQRHGYNNSGACGHRHHGSQDLCRRYDGWVGALSRTYTIALNSLVTAGKGTPTGTVSVYG